MTPQEMHAALMIVAQDPNITNTWKTMEDMVYGIGNSDDVLYGFRENFSCKYHRNDMIRPTHVADARKFKSQDLWFPAPTITLLPA